MRVLLVALFIFSAHAASAHKSLRILSYKVEITPNFLDRSIVGREQIVADLTGVASLSLNGLVIDSIQTDNRSVQVQVQTDKLLMSNFSRTRSRVVLSIEYHGVPTKGLTWGADHVYSGYFTCHWLICDEDPGVRSKFEIELIVPSSYKTTASGDFVGETRVSPALRRHHWVEKQAYSSYIFGFAAGDFHEAVVPAKGTVLRVLGVLDRPDALLEKFKETPRVLNFFENKSGVPLPHATYTQVLVPGSAAQENNAFATIGKTELDPILTDPQEDWSIVHELAHQWWGNLLTCKSWQHVWLNEGITTFMTAAYKEQRWGKAAYQRELDLFRQRWQRAIAAGFDVPLTYAGNYPSLGVQRAIVYSKAALFMDALRAAVGERNFWLALKAYTKQYAYRSVETADFQTTMEKVTGRNLSKLFKQWAY